MKGIIDRFEGDYAVVEFEGRKTGRYPQKGPTLWTKRGRCYSGYRWDICL